MTFEDLKLDAAIVQAVREQGYETPTPIQQQAIPLVLQGHDLLAGAQTGTGKTAAFSLPILQRLHQSPSSPNAISGRGRAIRALILSPTRELAAQIEENISAYARHLNDIRCTVIFGGVGMKSQIDRIERGVDILVATPGRLLDLQQQGFMDLSQVEVLVLDEADRMLDMGFIHDVKKVLALLPASKQSLLFSATFSDEIRELAATLLHNPQSVQVTPRNTTVQRISQVIYPVGRDKKKDVLLHIIRENNWSQVLVFTRTKFGANSVAEFLTSHGITAMALHGNKSQSARTQALAGFKTGELRVLVATDIAARGIDIDELPHVVNYEIPNVPEDYVHRIGRTGRAGREGHAVSLVCMDEEGFMMEIERFTKQEIPVEVLQDFGPAPDEKAEPIAMGRQTLWGGAGKPPSREVMAAAARAARQEMMQRIRTNKAAQAERAAERAAAKGAARSGTRTGKGAAPRGLAPAARQMAPAFWDDAAGQNSNQSFEFQENFANSENLEHTNAAPSQNFDEHQNTGEFSANPAPKPRRSGQGYNRSRQRPSARDRKANSATHAEGADVPVNVTIEVPAAAPAQAPTGVDGHNAEPTFTFGPETSAAPKPPRAPRPQGSGGGFKKPQKLPQGGRAARGGNGDGQRARGGSRRFDEDGFDSRFENQPPRPNAHLGTQLGHPVVRQPRGAGWGGSQPDPTRTSVDLMAGRPARGGAFSWGSGNAGGGAGGGGNKGGGWRRGNNKGGNFNR